MLVITVLKKWRALDFARVGVVMTQWALAYQSNISAAGEFHLNMAGDEVAT